MKIAINTRFLLSGKLEGIGWYTYEVSKRLVERHPEHEFLFLFDRAYSPEFVFGSNVQPLSVFPQARHPWLFYWWFEWSLPRVFRRHSPDVFFSPDGFLSLSAKVPTLLTIHDLAYLHFPQHIKGSHLRHYAKYMPLFARRAEHISTVSEYSKSDIVKQFDISPDKVSVAHPAGSPLFAPLAAEEQERVRGQYSQGKPYFVYVGAIHPRKNTARLLEAFDRFKASSGAPHQLLLVGRLAWKTGEIEQTLTGMRYRSEVHLLGHLPAADMVRIMASAFALVYPSMFEGFGIPIVDAQQAGVPVITSSCSSMPEAGGNAALYVEPHSVESIRQQMQALYGSEALRQHCIQAGMEHARRFSWERTTEGIEAALRGMGFDL